MGRTKSVREDVVVSRIRRYLKTLPACHFEKRWGGGPFAKSGLPDLSGCVGGRCFQLEVKRPGAKRALLDDQTLDLGPDELCWVAQGATVMQALELARWKRAGAVVGVVQSAEEVRELFEREGLAS